MIKIAVCDDEQEWRETTAALIEEYFAKYSEIPAKISTFASGNELLEDVSSEGRYNIYILEVIMPVMNGIETAERLREQNDNGMIIYLTTSKEFAVESYLVAAFNYLLKPVKIERLYEVMNAAVEKIKKQRNKKMSVKTKNDTELLAFDDICYVELVRKCLCFNMIRGEVVTSTSQRISFMEAVNPLFADKRFVPCGASFVINLFYIKSIEKNCIVFTNGKRLSVPKTACSALRKNWIDYWFEGENE